MILRRLDDDFCDPIELRATSALGVAGLMEAARSGNVVMANALGSGVLEAAAFKPLLAGLAERVIGESLILPDVDTWWCGRQADRRYVLDRLDTLLIKPAFRPPSIVPVFGGGMARSDRADLISRIRARPIDFVGQDRIALSTVPGMDRREAGAACDDVEGLCRRAGGHVRRHAGRPDPHRAQ